MNGVSKNFEETKATVWFVYLFWFFWTPSKKNAANLVNNMWILPYVLANAMTMFNSHPGALDRYKHF